MAQKAIIMASKNKGPVGVTLVKTPYSGNDRLVLCSATGMALQSGYALDRAYNSVVVESPYIGALLLFNLKALSVSTSQPDRDLSNQLCPRIANRLLQSMWSRLTRNDSPVRVVLDDGIVACQGAVIKGKRGPHTKFLDALNASLKDAPLAFKDKGDAPMLPLSYSAARGFSWDEMLPLLAELKTRAKEFETQWGWHCRDLKKTAEQIHEKRKKRREKPTYTVYQSSNGKPIVAEEYADLVDAHDRAQEIMTKAKMAGNPWVLEIMGNVRTLKDKHNPEGKLELAQEIRWRQGRCMLSIYRDNEKLVALMKPGSSAPLKDD